MVDKTIGQVTAATASSGSDLFYIEQGGVAKNLPRNLLDKHYRRVFNVLDYGAVGNGTTDDTVAFQACIDAAKAVCGTVFIPSAGALGAANYRITDTLNLNLPASTSQISLYVVAEGGYNTLTWDGSSTKVIFRHTGGMIGSTFENIKIKIPNSANNIKAWDFDSSAGGYFNSTTWRNCRVDLGTGVNNVGWRLDHTTGTGADISFLTWDNCSVAGGGTSSANVIAGQRGWVNEGANTLNLVWNNGGGFFLEKCVTNVSDAGASSAQGGGSMFFYGFGGGYNANDFEFGNLGTYLISGGRFELGKRFLNVTYGGNCPVITVQSVDMSDYTPGDGCLFRLSRPAVMQLLGVKIDAATADFTSAMIYVGGPAAGILNIQACAISAADPFYSVYPGDPAWDVEVTSTQRINRDDNSRIARFANVRPT